MSWLLWLLGRRYGPRFLLDGRGVRYCVRLWWWSDWQPVVLKKVAGPISISDELLRENDPDAGSGDRHISR